MRTPCERGWQWLRCRVLGHRDLTRGDVYSEELPDGSVKELHYCGACGGPAWVTRRGEPRPCEWTRESLLE